MRWYEPRRLAWRLCVAMIRTVPRGVMAYPPYPKQANWLAKTNPSE